MSSSQDHNERLRRRREREKSAKERRKLLLSNLRTQAEIAFESNSQYTLQRMLVTLVELLKLPRVSKERRIALQEIVENCAYGDFVDVRLGGEGERDIIHISGQFDVRDLAKKVVWGGVANEGNMQTIGGE